MHYPDFGLISINQEQYEFSASAICSKTTCTKPRNNTLHRSASFLFYFRSELTQNPRAKRVIFGTDERKKLPAASKAQKTPHSAACKVTCRGFCSWSCSGVLIGSRHVLTSAHCLDDVIASTLQVGFLERNRRFQWYNVMKKYVPSRWKTAKALTDDYAVLKLTRRPGRSYVSVSSVALSQNSVISITGEFIKKRNFYVGLWVARKREREAGAGYYQIREK